MTLVNARLTHIVPIAFFNPIYKCSFIVGTVRKFLLAVAMWNIFKPLSDVLVVLEWIKVSAFSVSFVVTDLTFVDAAIIENIPTFAFSFAQAKLTLVVRAVFEEELTATMKFLVCPLPSVVAFWLTHLLITIAKYSFCKKIFVFRLEFRQLLHLFLYDGCEYIDCDFPWHVFIVFKAHVGRIFCVVGEFFLGTAFILPHSFITLLKKLI